MSSGQLAPPYFPTWPGCPDRQDPSRHLVDDRLPGDILLLLPQESEELPLEGDLSSSCLGLNMRPIAMHCGCLSMDIILKLLVFTLIVCDKFKINCKWLCYYVVVSYNHGHSTVQYSTVQYNEVQYSTVELSIFMPMTVD